MNQEATTAARNDFGHKVPGKCSVSNNTRPILWNKRSLGIGTQKTNIFLALIVLI